MAGAAVTDVRVAFISSHAQLGGSESYLEKLVDRLGPGWVHRVVCLQEGEFVDRLRSHGTKVDVIATGAGPASIFSSSRRLKALLASDPPDVVHANGVKAALVAAAAGIRSLVWVKHDFSWDGWLGRAIARRCALVVGVSAAVLEDVHGSAQTVVVHNGLDPVAVDRAAARRSMGELAGDRPVVVLVGRLHPVKGHLDLLDAAPHVLAAVPDAGFVFLGGDDPNTPGHAAAVRERVAERGLNDHVVFAGHRADAPTLMAGADVGVISSVRVDRRQGREGFPLVGLELMAAGTPVVAYRQGGVPELLGDCGELVAPGDVEALGNAIARLLADDDARRRLSECGTERVARHFTFDAVVDAMRSHYSQVAGR